MTGKSRAKRLKSNFHCEKFKGDILSQISTSLSESGLDNTEKLTLIGNLTRLEHCKDCSTTENREPVVAMNAAPEVPRSRESQRSRSQRGSRYQRGPRGVRGPGALEDVLPESSFDVLLNKNVPHVLEKIFLSLDYASFKSCLQVSQGPNSTETILA